MRTSSSDDPYSIVSATLSLRDAFLLSIAWHEVDPNVKVLTSVLRQREGCARGGIGRIARVAIGCEENVKERYLGVKN